jgi:hypothetical protein
MSTDLQGPGHRIPLIPGAYEANTVAYRQPRPVGSDTTVPMPIGPGLMDAATILEREREGGGGPSQRPRKVQAPPQTGAALKGTERALP